MIPAEPDTFRAHVLIIGTYIGYTLYDVHVDPSAPGGAQARMELRYIRDEFGIAPGTITRALKLWLREQGKKPIRVAHGADPAIAA